MHDTRWYRKFRFVLSSRLVNYSLLTTRPVGAPIAGRISDWQVTRWRKRRGGKWVPEDRLRGLWFGAAVAAPLSVLCFGLVTRYVDGPLGIFLDLVCLFFNGMGVSPNSAFYRLLSCCHHS